MGFIKKAIDSAKELPKGAWLIALVVPGGFIVAGVWLSAKSIYEIHKGRNK